MSSVEKTVYHTQEKRKHRLCFPKPCNRTDAWLGTAYYYWYSEDDATWWGQKSKRSTGKYEVYKSLIRGDNFLDTAYNEAESSFFQRQIEKVASAFIKKHGSKPDVKYICAYINNVANWKSQLDGIIFLDIPLGDNSLVTGYPYKKRVQLAVYNKHCIENFVFYEEYDCVI